MHNGYYTLVHNGIGYIMDGRGAGFVQCSICSSRNYKNVDTTCILRVVKDKGTDFGASGFGNSLVSNY